MSKNRNYSPEFRAEAVKLGLEQGLSQEAAAKRLAIPKGTLGNWVAAAKRGGVSTPGARSVSELEAENARLRKELAEARQERDILKKATAYVAKESLQGTRS
jgi:transposase